MLGSVQRGQIYHADRQVSDSIIAKLVLEERDLVEEEDRDILSREEVQWDSRVRGRSRNEGGRRRRGRERDRARPNGRVSPIVGLLHLDVGSFSF